MILAAAVKRPLAMSCRNEYNTPMAKSILKRLVILLCIFVGCLIAFSIQINRKEVTYAAPVTGASLPMAYMQVEGMTVNPMTPYRQELQEAFERECLTPLSVDRSLTLLIDPKEKSVKGVSYQVTSLEDGSMMENGQLTEMEDAGGMLALRFRLTTTELHNEQEYMLRFAVDIGKGGTLYYYTRLMQYGAGNIGSYLSFTNSFIESATDKVAAADLAIYMEPDNTEPNRSLAHITITSSTELLSWSSLHPQIVMRMPPTIQEINDINAGIRQQYVIMATDEDLNEEYYTVDEYFRVTEYADRPELPAGLRADLRRQSAGGRGVGAEPRHPAEGSGICGKPGFHEGRVCRERRSVAV